MVHVEKYQRKNQENGRQTGVISKEALRLKIFDYLAERKLSRAQFATLCGFSSSLLDKVLTGKIKVSASFQQKLRAKTGLRFEEEQVRTFDFSIRKYLRTDVQHLEGLYQTIRPSYRHAGHVNGYMTRVSWSAAHQCLVFDEIDNDLSPKNSGYVSIPLYNRMMYFITCDRGNFRLSIVTDGYEDGIFYGAILTVASLKKMVHKMPTASNFVLCKIAKQSDAFFGAIGPGHEKFKAAFSRLKFSVDEEFFHAIAMPD